MVRRVPVAGSGDDVEVLGEALDWLGDLVPLRYLQRATGGEVVLEVDDEQCLGHRVAGAVRANSMLLGYASATAPPRRGSPPPLSAPVAGSRTTAWTPPKKRLRSCQRASW